MAATLKLKVGPKSTLKMAVLPGIAGPTGSAGATGADGTDGVPSGMKWHFDNSTAMADPGAGDLRLNNVSFASVTEIAVSALSSDPGNPDVSDYVATWDDSSNVSNRGTLILRKVGMVEQFAIYVVNLVTDNTTWLQLGVTHVTSAGGFIDGDPLAAPFNRTGDAGSGVGTGDVVGPASSTDSGFAKFDGATGKLLKNSAATIAITEIAGFTSAQLKTALSDETGSGAAVFANTPTLVTPVLGVASATSVAVTDDAYDATTWNGSTLVPTKNAIRDKIEALGGGGDFVGPASSTDNAMVRFDGATGKLGQNSGVIVDDSNNITGAASVVVGHTAPITFSALGGSTIVPQTQNLSASDSGIAVAHWSTGTAGPYLVLAKSKHASIGSHTVVTTNTDLGIIDFQGSDGTVFRTAAYIRAQTDGGAGSGDMPGRLVFATTADGGSVATERLILDSAGVLKPNANDGVALGTTALGFSDLHLASGGVINVANGTQTLTPSAGLWASNVDISVPDEAYGAGWNASLEVPTKNAVFDKIEALVVGSVAAATQAEEEAASSTTVYTSPGRQRFHPGMVKGWVLFNGTGTPATVTSYNVTGNPVDNGTGDYTINWGDDFSTANYCVSGNCGGAGNAAFFVLSTFAAGSIRIVAVDLAAAGIDKSSMCVLAEGDQ